MCSDGLLDLYEDNGMKLKLHALSEFWIQLLVQREKSWDDSNLALYLLRDALGGEDMEMVSRMITVEMPFRWMDDTTILVQRL
jgi:pyruvate dehydrogenase phosphatase